jgi:hypothetical protein
MLGFINGASCRTDAIKPVAGFLDGRNLIVHCFFSSQLSTASQYTALSGIIEALNTKYGGKYVFTAVAGSAAVGPEGIAQSFQTAQCLVKTLFYSAKGVLRTGHDIPAGVFELPDCSVNEFDSLLLHSQLDETHTWLDKLEESITRYPLTEIGYVKNVYYNFYVQIAAAVKKRNLGI